MSLLREIIRLYYAEIIRTESIFFVKDKDDYIREVKSEADTGKSSRTTYETIYPWDRQADLMEVQAKAMNTLAGLIKLYEELSNKDWELLHSELEAKVEAMREKLKGGADDSLQILLDGGGELE